MGVRLGILGLVFVSTLAAKADDGLKVSVVAKDVTPQLGVPLGGYGAPSRRKLMGATKLAYYFKGSTGKLDPIRAKAFMLSRHGKKLLFVSIDVVGVDLKFRDNLLSRIKPLGLDDDDVFIAATHTHSGPGAITDNHFFEFVAMDKFVPEVYKALENQVVDMIYEANRSLTEGEIYTVTFATSGLTDNRAKKGREINKQADLLVARALDGTYLGALVHFAVHGTAHGAGNLKYSADVPGAIEREVARVLARKNAEAGKERPAEAVFINGAEGDVRPVGDGEKAVKAVGEGFAAQAEAALAGARPLEPTWSVESREIEFQKAELSMGTCILQAVPFIPFVKGIVKNVSQWMPNKTRVWSIKLGDLRLMTWPGEPTSSMGFALQAAAREAGEQRPWVLGLTNDYLAYFTSPTEKEEKTYEACFSFYGKDGGTRVLEGHRALLVK